jgi:hypothetical protein
MVAGALAAGCAGSAVLRPPSQYSEAVLRMGLISGGVLMYSTDYDAQFMPGARWMDLVEPYTRDPRAAVSPAFDDQPGKYGFALNELVAGRSQTAIEQPDSTLLVFDSTDTRRNAVATSATLPIPPRYGAKNALSYVDGYVPDYPPDPPPSQLDISLDRMKKIGLATMMYGSDWDDVMPLGNWMDSILPYTQTERNFRSPIFDGTDKYGYAMNVNAVGVSLTAIPNPSELRTHFDSTLLMRNAVGPESSMPQPGRYDGKNTSAFADGHAAGPELLRR